MLYSYCKIFNISPHEARHTKMSLMLQMITIHSEAEAIKAEKLEKELGKVKTNGR
tara:strand:+ start:2535 stop:2699 length:165 start_codon:yes stop_codon:yes gene_type:complete